MAQIKNKVKGKMNASCPWLYFQFTLVKKRRRGIFQLSLL